MYAQTKRRRSVTTTDQAIALLFPIAALFDRLGMSRSQSLAALAAAISNVRGPARKRLEHIGTPACYADLIAAWTRQRRFLDSRGRPRALTMTGTNGFLTLARETCADRDPSKLLNVLIRYKNVRRLNNGTFQLVSPFFCAAAGSKVALEPIAYFLNDVTAALTHMLKHSRIRSNTQHFWRTVESVQISPRNAKQFVAFAKERSLIFLEEMDDWLLAHSDASYRRVGKQSRVGLGLFSIHSN
jgi:Family of unknown function (DUF6502)